MVTKRETASFRDNQADAMPSVHDPIECADENCDATASIKDAKNGDWLTENDPDTPVLCPSCRDRTPDETMTPTDAAREYNHGLTKWVSGADKGDY